MGIRTKLLLVFIVLGIVPMLLLSVGAYWSGGRAIEQLMREDVAARAAHACAGLTAALNEREADLRVLAAAPAVSAYLREPQTKGATADGALAGGAQPAEPPAATRALFAAFISNHADYFASLTLIGADGQTLGRFEPPSVAGGAVVFTRGDVLTSKVLLDGRVWATGDAAATQPLRAPVARETFGAGLRYTVPVRSIDTAATARPVGALVAEVKLDPLFEQIEVESANADNAPERAHADGQVPHLVVIVDHAGQIVYHTTRALPKYSLAAEAMPGFAGVARQMMKGERGSDFYEATDDHARWLVDYRPVTDLDLSVAVAANATAAGAGLQLTGKFGLLLTLLTTLAAVGALIVVVEGAARHINRVAEAAAEIAAGNLGQHIYVKSTDETRLLAESFNLMSDRLREHIAREAETKQFQSFLRLSAMLTHDLKNAITGLSMLVSNMERHMHRADFRADAISSLRAATDKLRGIVARLNEPARTLSGEYRHAIRVTDLVPLVERVLQTTAAPAAALHQIETKLPAQLVAPVDAERIERALENLVLNAIEAMGAREGRLSVEAGADGNGYVFISVCDTGQGMSEEFIRTRLFRPFSTTKEKGIGLGLYTCREIVAAHSGRLEVKSEIGAGTCFRVVLPSTPVTRFSQISGPRSQQTTDRTGNASA